MEDGKWIDGIKSCTKFFVEEKELDVKIGTELAKYIFANPTLLNQYQLEWMDADTLTQWYDKVLKLQKYEETIKIQNMSKWGQGEVDYKQQVEENKCIDCKWFIVGDPKNPEGPGTCQIVSDEIMPMGGCKEFIRDGSLPDEEEKEEEPNEEEETETPEEQPMEEIPMEQEQEVPEKPVIDLHAQEKEDRVKNLTIERAVLVKEINRIPKWHHKSLYRFYNDIRIKNQQRIAEIDKELKKNKI